ncbi:MAG: hypothetical protein JG764_967 [Clostridiales bacterium]|jgi:hypothetical protein|nr:hypothetical protein [Clostridiales bacterium]
MKLNHKSTIFTKVKFNINYNAKDGGHVRYIASRAEKDIQHIGYMGDRPRSTGLFGPEPDRLPSLKEGIKLAREKDNRVSWRLIISLREDDAKLMGYTERKDWEDLTRRCMSRFSRAVGIEEDKLKWLAAFHREPGHPHAHVLVWPEGVRRRGNLSAKEMKEFRRGIAQEVLGEYRRELAIQKTAARNAMLDTVKEAVQDIGKLEKRMELEMQAEDPIGESFPPRFYKDDLDELHKKLTYLAEKMPGRGRVALKYMPQEVKEEVRRIADFVLQKKQMEKPLKEMEDNVRKMARIYTYSKERGDEAWQKAYDDVRDRVANILLREAAGIQQQNTKFIAGADKEKIPRSTYRAAFRVIEKERLRAEAQAELASMRAEEKARRQEEIRRKRDMGIEEERL